MSVNFPYTIKQGECVIHCSEPASAEIYYSVPEWNEDTGEESPCFDIGDDVYYLEEFMVETMEVIPGYKAIKSETYFSGVALNLSDCGSGVTYIRYYT